MEAPHPTSHREDVLFIDAEEVRPGLGIQHFLGWVDDPEAPWFRFAVAFWVWYELVTLDGFQTRCPLTTNGEPVSAVGVWTAEIFLVYFLVFAAISWVRHDETSSQGIRKGISWAVLTLAGLLIPRVVLFLSIRYEAITLLPSLPVLVGIAVQFLLLLMIPLTLCWSLIPARYWRSRLQYDRDLLGRIGAPTTGLALTLIYLACEYGHENLRAMEGTHVWSLLVPALALGHILVSEYEQRLSRPDVVGELTGVAGVELSTIGATCAVCGDVAGKTPLLCQRCAAPYHSDCWEYAGRCAIFACGGSLITSRDWPPAAGDIRKQMNGGD